MARTSRNAKRRRKTSRQAKPKKRTSRGTVRKGLLKIGSVHAQEFKGKDPMLKGRIALNRGAGVLEFPDPNQFHRIAREEGIAKEEVDKAFGHMKQLVKNAARGKRSVKRGSIYSPTKLNGAEEPFYALEVVVPARFVDRIGAERAVMMDLGGRLYRIERGVEGYRLAKPWVTKNEWQKAFGHLRGSLVGRRRTTRGVPMTYRARSMRLGHRNEAGDPVGGIVRGQLVLFHKPTGQIVWEAIDDSEDYPRRPILVRLPGGGDDRDRTGHFDLDVAVAGARVGRGERRSDPVGAVDLGIPPIAMVEAFGHLLPPKQRREAFGTFVELPPDAPVDLDE